jgi:hypothetical protein
MPHAQRERENRCHFRPRENSYVQKKLGQAELMNADVISFEIHLWISTGEESPQETAPTG